MESQLREKTHQYEEMLASALTATVIRADLDEMGSRRAEECDEMARAYLVDGRHFRETDDWPNALAAFSYGHGWLDAGIRIGLLDGPTPSVKSKED